MLIIFLKVLCAQTGGSLDQGADVLVLQWFIYMTIMNVDNFLEFYVHSWWVTWLGSWYFDTIVIPLAVMKVDHLLNVMCTHVKIMQKSALVRHLYSSFLCIKTTLICFVASWNYYDFYFHFLSIPPLTTTHRHTNTHLL